VIFLLTDAEEAKNSQLQLYPKTLDVAKPRNGPSEDMRLIFLPAVGGFEQILPDHGVQNG
jgi:hypothetical protein